MGSLATVGELIRSNAAAVPDQRKKSQSDQRIGTLSRADWKRTRGSVTYLVSAAGTVAETEDAELGDNYEHHKIVMSGIHNHRSHFDGTGGRECG